MAFLDINKKWSPNDLAKYVGSASEAWDQKEFFYNGEKYKIHNDGKGRRKLTVETPTVNDIKSGNAYGASTKQVLVNEISKQMIELEDKLAKIPNVTFTTEELDSFMNKALNEITPYYEKKKAEIEAGIKEGRVQTAQDTLNLISQVETDVKNTLSKYDIEQAQTEEEFVNKLADITSSSSEAMQSKKFEWQQRLDAAKSGLSQKGILTSGIGQKQVTDLKTRQEQEMSDIQRRTEQATTEAQTTKKFSLDRITLARQAITDDRNRRIGAPQETAQLEAKARAEAGLAPDQPIASQAQVAYDRGIANKKTYDPTALTSLEEERRAALEQTKLKVQQNEEDIRNSEYESQRKAIQAQIARKQSELSSYR